MWLDDIEQHNLCPIYKYKLAFPYQKSKRFCVQPRCSELLPNNTYYAKEFRTSAKISQKLINRRSIELLLHYSDHINRRAKAALNVDTAHLVHLMHFQAMPTLSELLSGLG